MPFFAVLHISMPLMFNYLKYCTNPLLKALNTTDITLHSQNIYYFVKSHRLEDGEVNEKITLIWTLVKREYYDHLGCDAMLFGR
jgi:hypothetical protein